MIGDPNPLHDSFGAEPFVWDEGDLWVRTFPTLPLENLLPEVVEIENAPWTAPLKKTLESHDDVSLTLFSTFRFEQILRFSEINVAAITVTTYNISAFIRETLDSISGQDYSPLIIVVVDDESNDGTQDIVKRYMVENTSSTAIVFLSIPHLGWPAVTRNFALYNLLPNNVRYVGFMDGDDIYASPNAVGLLISALREQPQSIGVFGDFDRISAKGKRLAGPVSLRRNWGGGFEWRASRRLTWRNLASGKHPSYFLQSLIVRTGTPFIPYYYSGDDAGYYVRLFAMSARLFDGELDGLIQVPIVVFRYRILDSSLSNAPDGYSIRTLKLPEDFRLGWERTGVAEANFRAMGMPEQYITRESISAWLAKRWIDEAFRAFFRGKVNLATMLVKRGFVDRRVSKMDLAWQTASYLSRWIGSPRILALGATRILRRFRRIA